jgi:hypothetical protein
MTSQRLPRRILRLTLIALVITGFGRVYSQPKSGDWKVIASFGEFTITVSAGGTSVTTIKYTFTGFTCGGSTYSGGMTSSQTPAWSITNNQFSIVTNLNPFTTNEKLTINGTFSPAGDQMSGTWSANIKGTVCSGNWGPVGPATSVEDESGLPKQFALEHNYPNPFNPSTTIKYELPRTSNVTLSVYDILGREVSVLVNEKREAGVHEVKFDGSNLASGVYFYRLQAGDFVATNELVLLK